MKTVLITGCSTGIGYETALLLARKGWRVFATMRHLRKAAPLLEAARNLPLEVLPLDVTQTASVKRAVAECVKRAGRLDALVNNAGFGVFGASDEFTDGECRAQFATNVYGLHRVTRECLPILRRQGGGRVVNVGSLAGRITFAGIGLYCASKFAVEAYTESLRLEVGKFNIQACVVEPGQIHTPFKANQVKAAALAGGRSAHQTGMEKAYQVSCGRSAKAPGPGIVARTIADALSVPVMDIRYPVGFDAFWYPKIRWWIPNPVWDFILQAMYRNKNKGADGGSRMADSQAGPSRTKNQPLSANRYPQNNVALVTGSTSGIGMACALELASHGWRVYAGYRDPKKLKALRAASKGMEVIPVALDVDRASSVNKAVTVLWRKEGRLDAIVNNAGFALAGCWEDLSDEDLSAQMETNVFGCLRIVRAASPFLRRQGHGRVLHINSVSSFSALPGLGAYAASKHALRALNESLRTELAPFGVQVSETQLGEFNTHVVAATRRGAGTGAGSAYADYYATMEKKVTEEFKNAPPPSVAARAARRALESRHMARRYLVKGSDRLQAFLRWALPDGIWEAMIRRFLPF
jgi:NAD(P)-dependent dehydrogenase (short-subunit alcohol dehydrogenase family)